MKNQQKIEKKKRKEIDIVNKKKGGYVSPKEIKRICRKSKKKKKSRKAST